MKNKTVYIAILSLIFGVVLLSGCSTTHKTVKQQKTTPKKRKPTPPPPPPQPKRSKKKQPAKKHILKAKALKTIHFAFNKSNISTKAARLLAHNVQELQKYPKYHVRIDAYTDHIGSDQYNVRLSVQRAKAVAHFYETNNIAKGRIKTRGLGKAPVPCLKETPHTLGCRKNRRAESHPIKPLG
ncbi:MAG TPA: OmpA family protein [Balneolaceae bacterium]|nr:OmpA family protein [Balneolaceae bacterium]